MFYPVNKSPSDWQQYTLVLPAVSVGNVGQLAVDLLISTLELKKTGFIYHESILPLVGNDPFVNTVPTSCTLVTSCEVYEDRDKKLVVIQQRAPLIKGKKSFFVSWLAAWIKEQKFKQVVIVTSSYSHERLDTQLSGSQFRYLASRQAELVEGDKFEKLKWQKLEKRDGLAATAPSENDDTNVGATVYIPGGGIAKALYKECYSDVAMIVMLTFCSEGDNAQDAINIMNHLNEWLHLVEPKVSKLKQSVSIPWKLPVSWKLMFGSPVDRTLFH
ncbi:hypothetical protein ScPMuIL_000577 [Solemya velum]